jgi:ABC-2 type transport system permease protein
VRSQTFSHHVSVAVYNARLTLQRQLEYPVFLIGWALMCPLQYLAGVWLLKVLVDRFQPLAGWEFPQLAFLYGLALLSHGLQVVFFIQTWGIDYRITSGRFDRILLRPLNPLLQFLTEYINLIGIFDLIPGVIIFTYGWKAAGVASTPGNVLMVSVVVIAGTLLRAGVFMTVGSIAFWTQRSRPLIGVALDLQQQCSLYPLSIYAHSLQWLLTFVIPIGFISFYPASALLDLDTAFHLPGPLVLLSVLAGLLVFGLGVAVFTRGLRRYESSGS